MRTLHAVTFRWLSFPFLLQRFSAAQPRHPSCGVVRRKNAAPPSSIVKSLYLLRGRRLASRLGWRLRWVVTGQVNRPDELLSVFGPAAEAPESKCAQRFIEVWYGSTPLTRGVLAEYQPAYRSPGPALDATLPSFLL